MYLAPTKIRFTYMSSKFDSYQKRRLRSSYASVVISIALVLFLVGILGLVLLKSTKVANYFKEEIVVTLYLKDGLSEVNRNNLQNALLQEDFTRKTLYTSKEEAAKNFRADLGEDFVAYLGTNPLKSSIDVYLKAAYVNPEKISEIANRYSKNAFVFEVSYDKPLVTFLTKNIQKISFWMLIVCMFFGVIATILINSSIRLSIYAKRFNIKTMQMVGATKRFIRKPFIWNSIKLGMIGAVFALIALGFVIYHLDKNIPSLALISDYIILVYLGSGVLAVAFLITWISTFMATQRFLNLQTDELYY